ncbi:hypothetical protein A2U01_0111667, partial [Trifolium medium]|nr:hypothetical protein [Trifolium medium]
GVNSNLGGADSRSGPKAKDPKGKSAKKRKTNGGKTTRGVRTHALASAGRAPQPTELGAQF